MYMLQICEAYRIITEIWILMDNWRLEPWLSLLLRRQLILIDDIIQRNISLKGIAMQTKYA